MVNTKDCERCSYIYPCVIGSNEYAIIVKYACSRTSDIDGKLQYIENLDECPLIKEKVNVECLICEKMFEISVKKCNSLGVYVCDKCKSAVKYASTINPSNK